MGPTLTPLTRNLLIGLVALYILQLVAENWLGLPVSAALAWWPFESGAFRPWQPLTAMVLGGPTPLNAFLSWLMLAFLVPPSEMALGTRGVLRVFAFTWILSAVLALALDTVGGVAASSPFFGQGPFLTALICLFGFMRPNAQILLFFVLPIRASWVAWGTGLLALLGLLARRDLDSALWVGGWLAAFLWLRGARQGIRGLLDRTRVKMRTRKARRFTVIPGDRDGQMYH